jgi:hypothetical protein
MEEAIGKSQVILGNTILEENIKKNKNCQRKTRRAVTCSMYPSMLNGIIVVVTRPTTVIQGTVSQLTTILTWW